MPPPGPRGPASLRGQLALWHGAILSLVVAGLVLFVYSLLALSLAAEIDASLASRARKVGQLLGLTARLEGWERIDIPPPETLAVADTFVQVSTLAGESLGASENLEGLALPVEPARVAALLAERERGLYDEVLLGDQRVRTYTSLVWFADAPAAVLTVGRSLGPIDEALDRLRWLGGIGLVAAVGLASLGVWLTTGQALRPLERLIALADAIEALPDLRRRVEPMAASTEFARLAATFNRMLARLEAADAAQQRFVADASHELRTPLTTIRGNAELLRTFPDVTPEDRAAALAQIQGEAERLSRLVQDLLVLALADAGQPPACSPVDLAALAREVAALARYLASGQHIRLDIPRPVTVLGDADALRQLLLILLDNATKYTPANGAICICLTATGARAILTVRDSGPGIAPEHLPHLFERFYRVDRGRQAGGTGLGLAIAQRIVARHAGRIAVESAPGRGTAFIVTLPLAGP